jgi:hypothetical protein
LQIPNEGSGVCEWADNDIVVSSQTNTAEAKENNFLSPLA